MIGLIAATTPSGVIGVDGRLPWHLESDMRLFRDATLRSTVIMGRRTAESLCGALEDRRNLVLSRRGYVREGFETFASFEAALDAAGGEVTWVIGGASVYRHALAKCTLDRVLLSVLTPETSPSVTASEVTLLPRLELPHWGHSVTRVVPHPYSSLGLLIDWRRE